MCLRCGEYMCFPFYLRLIWGEFQNGWLDWELLVGKVEDLLGLTGGLSARHEPLELLDINLIALEARNNLTNRRGNKNLEGLLCVDELAQV